MKASAEKGAADSQVRSVSPGWSLENTCFCGRLKRDVGEGVAAWKKRHGDMPSVLESLTLINSPRGLLENHNGITPVMRPVREGVEKFKPKPGRESEKATDKNANNPRGNDAHDLQMER